MLIIFFSSILFIALEYIINPIYYLTFESFSLRAPFFSPLSIIILYPEFWCEYSIENIRVQLFVCYEIKFVCRNFVWRKSIWKCF